MLFIDESIIKLLTEIPTHYSHYYHNYYYYFYQIIINYKVFKVFLSNIFQEASQSLGLLDVGGGGGEKELIREVRSQERLTYERSRGGGAWLKLTGGQNESLYLISEVLPTFIKY